MPTHELFNEQDENGTSVAVTCYGSVRVLFTSLMSSSIIVQTQVAPVGVNVFGTVNVSSHGTPFIIDCGSSGLQIRQVLTGYDDKSIPVSSVVIEDEAEE